MNDIYRNSVHPVLIFGIFGIPVVVKNIKCLFSSAHINESNPSTIQPLPSNKTQDRPGENLMIILASFCCFMENVFFFCTACTEFCEHVV